MSVCFSELASAKTYQYDQYCVGILSQYIGLENIPEEQIPDYSQRVILITLDLCCIKYYKTTKDRSVNGFQQWLTTEVGFSLFNTVRKLVEGKLSNGVCSKTLSKTYKRKRKLLTRHLK